MIQYDHGGRLIESVPELPSLAGAEDVYLDVETSSGDPQKDSLNPWHDCSVAGLGITVDNTPTSWYIPLGHYDHSNLPRDVVSRWLNDILRRCRRWINHNVKYDAHVVKNELGVNPNHRLVDTLTLAKIVDSDRIGRGGYALKALSDAWLHEDIEHYEESLQPYLYRNKDYGRIPADIMGEYGCQDVLTGRRLFHYIDARCPEQCRQVWDTEISLTRVLFDMEQNGMYIDPQELKIKELLILNRLTAIDEELTEIIGRSFRPHVSGDCFDVLCNQYGLPVVAWTKDKKGDETVNPSFDKAALAQYASNPYAPQDVVQRIIEFRQLNTLCNFFVRPYQELHVERLLHSSYNQAVRTGRMSCKRPNSQQLSSDAKKLVHPRPGNAFISIDYSQIEFRIIVHYIQDTDCIAAYQKDSRTDFHQWVADMIPMARRPAKNVNFMMGYGGGRDKCVKMLATNMEVVGGLKAQIDELLAGGKIQKDQQQQYFELLCTKKADRVYEKYHATLPGLKRTTWRASEICKSRGYVYNGYGRHRHLPETATWKAFNTLCQSTAADLMKERTVAVAQMCQGTPILLIASVHDETLFEAPIEVVEDPRTVRDLAACMENPTINLRVPICVDVGTSKENWVAASKSASGLDCRGAGSLNHLR